jgi:hypothetical protein
MLPPFIIDEIRKREQREREDERPQPRLELPLDRPARRGFEPAKEEAERGVVILDI